MLLPVQWTALRRFIWTVPAPARSPAAPQLSAVDSPGSEGLTRLGELAWVSCTHGGRRYGQGGGHGDGPWLRSYQWEHPGHQSGDHRILQVSPLRCWCCCVCARVWGAPRALGTFCCEKKERCLSEVTCNFIKFHCWNIAYTSPWLISKNNNTLQKVKWRRCLGKILSGCALIHRTSLKYFKEF